MGVEIKVDDLTKSFGKQLIWGDVTLTLPAGEICVMLGPSGTGKSVFLKTLIGLLKPDKGSIIIEGTDIASCSEKELYEIRKLFGVLFQDGAHVRLDEPLRQRRLPAARAHQEVRVRDPRHRHGEDGPGRPDRRRGQASRRDLRRHAQARRPGPRAGARPRDRPLRRARLRPRPGPHGVPQPADHRPERADRRDVPDRHPRRQHRPHGARQHRPALPPAPGDVRPARDAAVLRGAGGPPVPQRPAASARSACPRRRTPTSSQAEKDQELPPLPPIPLQQRALQRHPAPQPARAGRVVPRERRHAAARARSRTPTPAMAPGA